MANPNMLRFLENNGKQKVELTVIELAALASGLAYVYPERRGVTLKKMLNTDSPIKVRIPDPQKGAETVRLWLMPLRGILSIAKEAGISITVSMSDMFAMEKYIKQPLYGQLLVDLFS